MPTRSKKPQSADVVGVYWLACDTCRRWEVYENTGLPGPYDEVKVRNAKFNCQLCAITIKLDLANTEITILKNKIVQLESVQATKTESEIAWVSMVNSVPADIKATQDRVKEEISNFKKEFTEM